jgi:hypothetical protein
MDDRNPLDSRLPRRTSEDDSLRSPVRPSPPIEPAFGAARMPQQTPPPSSGTSSPSATNPSAALDQIREKTERIADEYSQGKLNRAQFEAMYKRYNEQRTIIEKLLERNPGTDAWRSVVGTRGQTGFLREQYEAQALFYAVYLQNSENPLISAGTRTYLPQQFAPLARAVWSIPNRAPVGLGRKQLRNNEWLIMATGEHGLTLVVYSMEPANSQAKLIRDLHADFERANRITLARKITAPDKLVFPQRSLFE